MSFLLIAPTNLLTGASSAPVKLLASDVDTIYSGPDNVSEPGVNATGALNTMFIRFVVFGPTGVTLPSLWIAAGTANPTAITSGTSNLGLYNIPNPPPMTAETATVTWYNTAVSNVFLVKVFIDLQQYPYQLYIQNNDGKARDFTLVVAGSLSDSLQPWLDVPGTLPFDLLTNLTLTNSIILNNKGTGPLSVTALTPALGQGFSTSATFPISVPPNPLLDSNDPKTQPMTIPVLFTGPGTPGITSLNTVVTSSDAGAGAMGHNNAVALSATTRGLEVAVLLDDSGSMALAPDGSNAPIGQQRWDELVPATQHFLEWLAGFAAGTGTFGIAKFPPNNPNDLTSYDVVPPATIPNSSGIAAAEDTIAKRTIVQPFNSTPMGDGINRVISVGSPYFSTYSPNGTPAQQFNRRWLLIFSDGKNNSGSVDPRQTFISSANNGGAAKSLADRRISVFSVAYGSLNAGQVDTQLMIDLANDSLQINPTQTKHQYVQVDTGQGMSSQAVSNAMKNAIISGLVPETPSDPRGACPLGGKVTYPVQITPYDDRAAFSLTWEPPYAQFFTLSLITPLGETIQPNSQIPGVSYSNRPRFAIYQIEKSYLTNSADSTKPRFGTWTLVVSRDFQDIPAVLKGAVPFEYSVIVRSRLRLEVAYDRLDYYAGDPIGVKASVLLDGVPLTGLIVTAGIDSPNQSADNSLAAAPVTQAEYDAMKQKMAGQDVNAIYIKGLAAGAKGITFPGTSQSSNIVLSDPSQTGVYSGVVTQTTTPDIYKFSIAAVGQTPDGFIFRRESHDQVRVGVKPDAASTLIDLQFLQPAGQNSNAIMRVFPRDRFGNVILLDPADPVSIQFTTTAGQFTNAITTNFDGSYSQNLTYPTGSTPSIGVTLRGKVIVPGVPVPPIGSLTWADELITYYIGGQAAPGANQHTDPHAALGNPLSKGDAVFVSLGAHGSLTVGVGGTDILAAGTNDVVIVVHPDDSLRAYLVEAESASTPGKWVKLGTSPGITRGFNLKAAGLRSASAIRVTDESGRTRDNSGRPSATPGVSIRGVGFRKTGTDPYPPPPDCSDCLKKLCEMLRKMCS
jgi:hypothetical protein